MWGSGFNPSQLTCWDPLLFSVPLLEWVWIYQHPPDTVWTVDLVPPYLVLYGTVGLGSVSHVEQIEFRVSRLTWRQHGSLGLGVWESRPFSYLNSHFSSCSFGFLGAMYRDWL